MEKTVLYHGIALAPVSKNNWPYTCVSNSGCPILFHWYICLSLTPVLHWLDYCTFKMSSNQVVKVFQLYSSLKSCFGYSCSLHFYMHFRIRLSIYTSSPQKNPCWNYAPHCTESMGQPWETWYLNNSLPIHERSVFLHLI